MSCWVPLWERFSLTQRSMKRSPAIGPVAPAECELSSPSWKTVRVAYLCGGRASTKGRWSTTKRWRMWLKESWFEAIPHDIRQPPSGLAGFEPFNSRRSRWTCGTGGAGRNDLSKGDSIPLLVKRYIQGGWTTSALPPRAARRTPSFQTRGLQSGGRESNSSGGTGGATHELRLREEAARAEEAEEE